MKPRVFIGSSAEQLPVARALLAAITHETDPKAWNTCFPPGATAVEAVDAMRHEFDFSVLIFGADDLVEWRGKPQREARDNVVLEFGFFMGALGRERTFVIHGPELDKAPSDLDGVTFLRYPDRDDNNVLAALQSVISPLLERIAELGPLKRTRAPKAYWAGPHNHFARNKDIRERFRQRGVDLILPGELESKAAKKGNRPRAVRSMCMAAIESADCVIVDLDGYGLDTAWEIGYADARQKRVIGVSVEGRVDASIKRRVERRPYLHNFMHGWEDQPILRSIEEAESRVEGRTVHICGPFQNEPALQAIRTSRISELAQELVLPSDLALIRDQLKEAPWTARNEAILALERADLAVVMLPRYGMDTSWQLGYAAGLGMEIVGLLGPEDPTQRTQSSIWEHWMHGWSEKPHLFALADAAAIARASG